MTDEKIVNNSKMIANQQAYNTDGAKDEKDNYIVVDGKRVHVGGAQFVSIDEDGRKELLERQKDVQSEKPISQTMIRTDVDSHKDYKVPELQNQARNSNEVGYTGSSLNITSYNVYKADGAQSTKPECVVVGVAGSAGQNKGVFGGAENAPDWKQNYDLSLNRSHYNDLSTAELERRANEVITRTVRPHLSGVEVEVKEMHPDRAKMLYEVEIRQKVEGLKKYRDKDVPIILSGDSKGGEDATYLALRSEQSGVSIDRLYLTNPKGIRVSGNESDETSDYGILCKMAKEGKIIKEIVYPEILRNGSPRLDGGGDVPIGREIPVSKTIFTVPKDIRNLTENHTIGNYENDVFQGVEGNYKFQCDSEPEKITKSITSSIMGGGSREELLGYRYKITKITNRSGQTISVNDYFFDEQVELVNAVKQRIVEMLDVLEELSREDVISYFSDGVGRIRNSLESKHEDLIENATPYETYKNDHKSDFEGKTEMEKIDIDLQLRNQYHRDIEQQVDEQSELYKTVVTGVVGGFVNTYKENVHMRKQELMREQERLEQVVIDINSAKVAHQKSQKEIEFVIEKRF